MVHRAKSCREGRAEYGGNDTSRNKLLRCTAQIRQNATFFAPNLSKAPENWLDFVQPNAGMPLSLFFPN
jgi:hypothetical protein